MTKNLNKFQKLCVIFFVTLIPLLASAASFVSDLESVMDQPSMTGRLMQLFLLMGVLSIAPAIVIMTTSFVRITIVLSMARSALGLQQTPSNQVMVGLALFLTLFIMAPTMEEAYNNGLKPLLDEQVTEQEAIPAIAEPMKKFMVSNTRSKDLDLFISIAKLKAPEELYQLPIQVVVPSFIISELRRGFEIGFLIYLPFLIIDIVVSSVLMAMGMMMMPPVMVALPFKVIFFVVIDGWYLLAGSLVRSFTS